MIVQEAGRWHSYVTKDEQSTEIDEILDKLNDNELASLEAILKEVGATGSSEIADTCAELEWEEVPIPIEEWLESYHHIGDLKDSIYPVLKQDLIDLFNGNYHEVILCVHPGTRIPLLDGTTPTIKDLAERWEHNEEPFWVYSYVNGELGPAQAVHPRQTGVDDYYRVTLDNGSSFVGNSRHQMLLRNGTKRMIKDMTVGDSLMPFEVRVSSKEGGQRLDGYEQIKSLDGSWVYTHRLVARNLCEKADGDEDTIHHVNFTKTDNQPMNLLWMRWKDHFRYHATCQLAWAAANPEAAARVIAKLLEATDCRWNGPNGAKNRASQSKRSRKLLSEQSRASKMGKVAWKSRSASAKTAFKTLMAQRNRESASDKRIDITLEAIIACNATNMADAARQLKCSESRIRKVIEDSEMTDIEIFGGLWNRGRKNKFTSDTRAGPKYKLTLEQIEEAISAGAATTRAAAAKLGVSKKTIYNTLKRLGVAWDDLCETVGNHYVVSVEKEGCGPVYCMTVPDAGNFAISTNFDGKEVNPTMRSGVISSNTGSTRWG